MSEELHAELIYDIIINFSNINFPPLYEMLSSELTA